jgi:hypothetical protein
MLPPAYFAAESGRRIKSRSSENASARAGRWHVMQSFYHSLSGRVPLDEDSARITFTVSTGGAINEPEYVEDNRR